MQMGPYIAERLMPKLIAAYCQRSGAGFQAFSDDWVLRLTRDGTTRWIVGYKFDVNRSAAGEVAQDKVATYTVLKAAGIEAIPHYLVRSLPHELIHVSNLHRILDSIPVVAKPLEGTSGRDVTCFHTVDEALAMIRSSGEPAWAVSPHADLQAEYRLIMLDGTALLVYEKTQPTFRGDLKLFNLAYGAVAVDVADPDLVVQLSSIARQVMDATALRVAAVDIVRMPDGSLKVLEVNDGITMEHYARQSAQNKERTTDVYDAIVAAMFS
jgi:glutathione synthase/RimK-type ligase-like ATP-grasp enzyme